MASPSADDNEEILLSCRYGDLEDIQKFVEKFGAEALANVRDDNGNTILHMICGNGHTDLLDYLLPLIPSSLLSAQNSAQSTALHWAALNSHLSSIQKLIQFSGGPGVNLIDIKNAAGMSPLAEAEQAGFDEGAQWLVGVMNLDVEGTPSGDDEEELVMDPTQDIQVEIEDAEGQVAKMTISGSASLRQEPKTTKTGIS
ncbi:ankyrin repeat-containing domain protein [Mycena floridula]|nr:ankyrin repeat-containing domain protein [Mycena floridula]